MKKSAVSCLPALLLFIQSSSANPFIESDGFVFFEAEDAVFSGDWVFTTELNHFSGDGYLVWDGPDLFNPAGAGRDTISYQFEITTPGNYELRWRTRIAKGDSNTEANDSYVRFPSGVNVAGEEPMFGWTKVFMGHHGAWFWDARVNDHVGANARQFFSAGTHVMEVSGRSNGHAIDKMALYRYESLELSPNDLDVRSGTPQSSIDGNAAISAVTNTDTGVVMEVLSGVRYTPGECSDGTLAIPAVADVHLRDGGLVNTNSLDVAPQTATALMRFDTSIVPQFDSAALEVSVGLGNGNATLEYALLDSTAWQESDAALDPAPQYVQQLALAEREWASGTRYSIPLNTQNLQGSVVNMSIVAVASDVALSLASREDSLEMPLLLLRGTGDFCETYRANVATLNPEAGETGSVDTVLDNDSPDEGDVSSTDAAGSTAESSQTGSGGGAPGLLLLITFLGLTTRYALRAFQPKPVDNKLR